MDGNYKGLLCDNSYLEIYVFMFQWADEGYFW